jgi:hypothetical protein
MNASIDRGSSAKPLSGSFSDIVLEQQEVPVAALVERPPLWLLLTASADLSYRMTGFIAAFVFPIG